MKKLTITIEEFGNSAFEDNDRKEVSRILREVADKIERGQDTIVPRDINGNKVGNVDIH